jgi:hypothetical protein
LSASKVNGLSAKPNFRIQTWLEGFIENIVKFYKKPFRESKIWYFGMHELKAPN